MRRRPVETGLIRDEYIGLQQHGAGHHQPLALAAAELVGEFPHVSAGRSPTDASAALG